MLDKRAVLLFLAFAFLATATSLVAEVNADVCPPGSLIINSTGTYICPVPVADINATYTSLMLLQNGTSFNFTTTCLTSGGCSYNITVYDYYNGTLTAIDRIQQSVNAGDSLSKSYTVSGTGMVELSVNNMYYGYYFYPASQSNQIATTLYSLGNSNIFIEIMVALILVSVPIGWALMREIGLAGLALTAMSVPLYTLISVLTSNPPIALLISVVTSFIGIVYLIMSRGEPA